MARPHSTNNLQAATLIDTRPARLQSIYVYNASGAATFIQMFNTDSPGTVTLGTTAPNLVIGVPSAVGIAWPIGDNSLLFGQGLTAAATTAATGGTTAATGVVLSVAVD